MSEYKIFNTKWFADDHPVNAEYGSATIGSGDNGEVEVKYALVGTDGNDYSIIVSDANDGDDDVDMTVEYDDGVITVLLGTDPDSESTATIGSGENGTVTVEVTPVGVDENDYTIAVVEGADGGNISAALVGTDITVTLGMTVAVAAEASVGSGDNGTVDISVVEAGADGNDYTVQVVEGDTDGINLSAVLTDTTLVVTLGTDGGDNAITSIGSGDNGTVTIEVDEAGSAGNNYTVTVDATILEQDRVLSAVLTDTALVVELATEGDVSASTTIGSGDNGRVNISADAAGSDGNSITVEVDADITAPNRPLSVSSLSPTELIVYLATEGVLKASSSIGTGDNGTVTIEVDEAGAGGNNYTVEVIAGAGVIDVSIDQYTITITLAAGGSTATAIADEINNNHGATLTATASGTGADTLTQAEAIKNFTGGTSQLMTIANTATLVAAEIQTSLDFSASASGDGTTSLTEAEIKYFSGGTNKLATASNTATLVAAAINDGTVGLTATASGDGTSSLTESLPITNFTGGGENFALDDVKNTATLVAGAINTEAIGVLTATASGTGNDPLTQAEAVQYFEGGVDSIPDNTKNVASDVATAISLLANITATASGTGATPLTQAEALQQFSGGTDSGDISAIKNTATLIADAINELGEFVATASGDGSGAITVAEESQDFTGGQYATISSEKGIIVIGGVWYVCEYPVDKWDTAGWKYGTPALIT